MYLDEWSGFLSCVRAGTQAPRPSSAAVRRYTGLFDDDCVSDREARAAFLWSNMTGACAAVRAPGQLKRIDHMAMIQCSTRTAGTRVWRRGAPHRRSAAARLLVRRRSSVVAGITATSSRLSSSWR